MQEIVSKGRNRSHDTDLNYLAKSGKVYLMDNHLAAFWCWSRELNLLKEYQLIHVDRHDDLSSVFVKEGFHSFKTIDFASIELEALLNLKVNDYQMLRWDNFIELFNAFHPFTFKHFEFVTPKPVALRYKYCDHTTLKKWIAQLPSLFEQALLLQASPPLTVLNFDVDVLFTEGPNHKKVLTAKQMAALADKLRPMIQRAELVTIALSPECCGGWDNCIDSFNSLNDYLDLGFDTKLI